MFYLSMFKSSKEKCTITRADTPSTQCFTRCFRLCFLSCKAFLYGTTEICCSAREICLTEIEIPEKLVHLYTVNTLEARKFRQCMRSYNNMFVFTSLGVHCEKALSKRSKDIYMFRIQRQIYHFLDSLVPPQDEKATNLQIYFHDTQHEIANQMAISSKFRESIIEQFRAILKDNLYCLFLRSLVELDGIDDYKIYLKCDPSLDERVYNLPTVSQVTAIWNENDQNTGDTHRQIEISTKSGTKRIIKQYYGCYDML